VALQEALLWSHGACAAPSAAADGAHAVPAWQRSLKHVVLSMHRQCTVLLTAPLAALPRIRGLQEEAEQQLHARAALRPQLLRGAWGAALPALPGPGVPGQCCNLGGRQEPSALPGWLVQACRHQGFWA
jgi:hypothetical protein